LSSQIIKPGPSLIRAARKLEEPKRLAGRWPYQWLFPGPNSKHVLANGSLEIPNIGATETVLSYQVPDGYRFSLRGIVFAFEGTGWNEGTATGLSFTLQVVASGTRNVDFLANVLTHLGSLDTPYPILGRLEFAPNDVLNVNVTNNGVTRSATTIATAILSGHTYPNAEVTG
jgi:hypothetical protein